MAQPQEYKLEEAILSADRDFDLGASPGKESFAEPLNLKLMVAELNLFESIEKGYITSTLGVVDDLGLLTEVVQLQGTERIKIKIVALGEGLEDDEIELNMKVVSIVSSARQNDFSSIYYINCISPYAYTDAAVKISRSYTGKMEDISEYVLKDFLNVGVVKDPKFWAPGTESIQDETKIILPYISPLETTEWLMERTTGKDGSPFFAWSNVHLQEGEDEYLYYGHLKTMLNEGYKIAKGDESYQFRYSIGVFGGSEVKYKNTRNTILDYKYSSDTENTLKMINQGTVGSNITNLDAYTTQKMDRHFNLEEYLKVLDGGDELFSTVLDEDAKLTVSGKKSSVTDLNARSRATITSYGTYEWTSSYHDVYDQTQLLNKIRKTSMLTMLHKNVLDVTLPGYDFMKKKIGIGEVVKLTFDSHMVDNAGAGEIDKRTSGYYLILNLRHVFQLSTHRVVISAATFKDLE